MAIDFDKVALEYAKKRGYDTIRPAGEKNGYRYYHYYNLSTLGHKLGLPLIFKINNSGKIIRVFEFPEIMWAREQIIRLNNL